MAYISFYITWFNTRNFFTNVAVAKAHNSMEEAINELLGLLKN